MYKNLCFILMVCLLAGCIGDDFVFDTVEPTLRIDNPIDTLALGSDYQFEFTYLNNVGQEEEVSGTWSSSDAAVIDISPQGLAQAIEMGSAIITVQVEADSLLLETFLEVQVGQSTVNTNTSRGGTIRTTSSYVLEGDFEVRQEGTDLIIDVADNYEASSALPGLYVYLTNNPNTTSGALEIGAVEVFNGAHSYTLSDVEIQSYDYLLYFCKPFNVKVGDGAIE